MSDSLFSKQPEAWTGADVADLVEARLPEGQRLEYKRQLDLGSDRQKSECAKDVSGMANAQGGWIFYGIEEDDSAEPLPSAIAPIKEGGLRTRLEDILESTLEPRAQFRAATVPVEGGSVVAIHVLPSSGNPIMVQGYKQFRYYRRNGTRTVPMTGDEVAAAHQVAQAGEDELAELLALQPLKSHIARTLEVDEVRLRAAGYGAPDWPLTLVVVTAALDAPRPLFPPKMLQPSSFPEDESGKWDPGRPVRPGGPWQIRAAGLNSENTVSSPEVPGGWAHHWMTVLRPGVIEWGRRYWFDKKELPGETAVLNVHDALLFTAEIFKSAGYYGRVKIFIRLENAEGAIPAIPSGWDLHPTPAEVNWAGDMMDGTVEDLREQAPDLTREAMDLIWQAFGLPRCIYFDQDGNFKKLS